MRKKLSIKQKNREEKEYLYQLHLLLDAIFDHAATIKKWTWEELAMNANLCYSTVDALGNRKTRYPRFCTVYKLAKAINWELALKLIGSKKMAV